MFIKEVTMNDKVQQILNQTYQKHGATLFLDNERLKAVLSDLLFDYEVEKKRLYLVINENIVKSMLEDKDGRKPGSLYITMLHDTYNLPVETAKDIVNAFSIAIQNKTYDCTLKSEESVSAKKKPVIVQSQKEPIRIFIDEEHKSEKKTTEAIRLFQNIDDYDDELKSMAGENKRTTVVTKISSNDDLSQTKSVIRNLDEYDDELKQMEKRKTKKSKSWFL